MQILNIILTIVTIVAIIGNIYDNPELMDMNIQMTHANNLQD